MVLPNDRETVQLRPYARLLTMLGEQLIKNDRIALVELIKNSYDADAHLVTVDFQNFSPRLESNSLSKIAIVDNGDGMSERTIRQDWLNPATPGKRDRKRSDPRSPGGRILQGEKGIGRFAMFKLGTTVEMTTRARGSDFEYVVRIDLSFLAEEERRPRTGAGEADLALDANTQSTRKTPQFIEDIPVTLERRPPTYFDRGTEPRRSDHGTRIEISGLRTRWTERAMRDAFSDVGRLQPLIPHVVDDSVPLEITEVTEDEIDFRVLFCRDGSDLGLQDDQNFNLLRLFEERAVLRVSGHFSDVERGFLLNINGHISFVSLEDPEIRGLRIYRQTFENDESDLSSLTTSCGPFDFSFYVFDLTPRASEEYRLDKDERELVKDHRIYLYRDGVRVLPYGDADDDWLQLDVMRGTQGANRVLSNDQIVGFVYITQEKNSELQDKTNREGLLEAGTALPEFIGLLQTITSYLRRADYARYLAAADQRRESSARHDRKVMAGFEELLSEESLPARLRTQVKQLHDAYRNEREYTDVRLERTEDLAGVGLSVEAASHDIVATADQALGQARSADRQAHNFHPEDEVLSHFTGSVVEGLLFVTSRLQDVQGLFVSTRKGKRDLQPGEFVTRVARMYRSALQEGSIRLQMDRESSPLTVRTTDSALLQVLVNLFDNAIYWLQAAKTVEPVVHIAFDVSQSRLLFADNGPGVRPEDEDFIFEPFFSGKGDAGKGLGLYIARHVAARNGFTVDLVTATAEKLEKGANFMVTFGGSGGDEDR